MNQPSLRKLAPLFAVSLIGLCLFLVLALHVNGDTFLTRFDEDVKEKLKGYRDGNRGLTKFLWEFTDIAQTYRIIGLVILVGGILVWKKHYWMALTWALVLAGGGLLDKGLKDVIQRERPPEARISTGEIPASTTWSFPSGHAMGAFVAYGMLIYVIILFIPRGKGRTAAVSVLLLLVLAVGFSRMYLCKHWFSDVIGGFSAGAFWLFACIGGIEYLREKKMKDSGG